MKVTFTVLYLTISLNGLSHSARHCSIQDFPVSLSMEDMENIVYSLAADKGVSATVILNRLLRKVRMRQRVEKAKSKNLLQEMALKELMNSETLVRVPVLASESERPDFSDRPPIMSQPLLPPPATPDMSAVIQGAVFPSTILPRNKGFKTLKPPLKSNTRGIVTGVLIPQGFPPQSSRPIFYPYPNLNPPPGITIRVKSGSSDGSLPEVTVTLSPMMTIIEALKQAENKFKMILGLSPSSDEDVISFSRSSYAECYVIRSFDNVISTENGYWKIIVSDVTGKVIYDSECLPSRMEVPIKPGMTITLMYALV